jgi:hypothetical protein
MIVRASSGLPEQGERSIAGGYWRRANKVLAGLIVERDTVLRIFVTRQKKEENEFNIVK